MAASATTSSPSHQSALRPSHRLELRQWPQARLYNYDNDGRLIDVSTGPSSSVLQRLTDADDASDVITKITNCVNAGLTQAYDYDELSRLTSMTGSAERGQVHLSRSLSDWDGSGEDEGG